MQCFETKGPPLTGSAVAFDAKEDEGSIKCQNYPALPFDPHGLPDAGTSPDIAKKSAGQGVNKGMETVAFNMCVTSDAGPSQDTLCRWMRHHSKEPSDLCSILLDDFLARADPLFIA